MSDEKSAIILSAEKLTKNFGSLRAIDGLSFEVYRGEVFGFLGPNGAGKTTSIKMLCGLLKPDSGHIEIRTENGQKSIGVCPQNIVVWENLTCIEQLQFMGEMYGLKSLRARQKGMELLEVFGLMEKKNKLSKTLSGGMQRRLNIALAFIHSPEIVILDEPQAGLDPQSRVLVRDYIKSVKSRTTVILTTHDMEEAEKLSDRVCIIDKGKELATGTVEQIKKSLGQADVFEIEIDGNVHDELLPYLRGSIGGLKSDSNNIFIFTAENVQETIGEVMAVVKSRNINLRNFRLRNTSLEDVFINLTGRRLRE